MRRRISTPRETLKRGMVFLKLARAAGLGYASRSASLGLGPCLSDEQHLREAMLWLCRAEDVTGGKGVSKRYHVFEGWDPLPYPETTGYILETFLAYAKLTGEADFRERALRMGDWEIEIQHPGGGVIGRLDRPEELRTFNTGQVIHGWCTLFEDTGERRFLEAALRAADYLLRVQEPDGRWEKDSFCGARTYDSRVAWALLRVAALARTPRHAEGALRNLDWVLSQQEPNGWWRNCGFFDRDPITHLLAYTIRGLLQSHLLLRANPDLAGGAEGGDARGRTDRYREAALRAAEALRDRIRIAPALGVPGLPHHSYGRDWTSRDTHSCLTGNVQLAGIFYILARDFGLPGYREVADTIVATAKRMQDLSSPVEGIRGGFPGPFPIYQGYDPFCFLNWATKFFADVLIFRLNERSKEQGPRAPQGGNPC